MESDISIIFTNFKESIEKDQKLKEEIKESVKNLEQAGRDIITILQIIHKNEDATKISSKCDECRDIIEKNVKPEFEKISKLLMTGSVSQYYKYHDNWRFISQRLAFVVSLIQYLETGTLVSYEAVAKALGVHCNREKGFHLDLEDYLTGLLQLASELSRLAVNSVVYGDYSRPIHISNFVTELNAGFRLLNLKNDALRKRFDALKYDVKKIEEVVYDLSIRGLKPDDCKA